MNNNLIFIFVLVVIVTMGVTAGRNLPLNFRRVLIGLWITASILSIVFDVMVVLIVLATGITFLLPAIRTQINSFKISSLWNRKVG